MRPNRPSKSMPWQYCLCLALLGLLIGAAYLSLVAMIEPPASPDYWVSVTILWVLAAGIVVILLLRYFTRTRRPSHEYRF